MPIRWDNFTVKAQEAVQRANDLAREHRNPELLPLHLLAALVKDKDGTAALILEEIGVQCSDVSSDSCEELKSLPKTSSDEVQSTLSNGLSRVLEQACEEATNLKNETVSTGHLLLALSSRGGSAARIIAGHGTDYDAILQALAGARSFPTEDGPSGDGEASSSANPRDAESPPLSGSVSSAIGVRSPTANAVVRDYQLCSARDPSELVSLVNRQISNGWQPIGGVSVSIKWLTGPYRNLPEDWLLVQAMAKFW